ncbi:MAG: hypothetical protein KatS3mg028_1646 [Bacteroidia bacterium]|nr:MAG: hypothetical protein KatS3mg028_1646 [Bacteroidia bacterium]
MKFVKIDSENKELQALLLKKAAEIHHRKADTLEWMQWKYFSSPFGPVIGFAAFSDDGNFWGECTYGRMQIQGNNKIYHAAYSYQTMTDASARRKGVFKNLHHQLFEAMKEAGVDGIFNFPNNNSFQPFLSLGYKPLEGIMQGLKINSLLLLKNFYRLRNQKNFSPDSVNQINAKEKNKLIEFFDKHGDKLYVYPGFLSPRYTKEFLLWRFFSFPLFDYKVVLYKDIALIARMGRRFGLPEAQIMEILFTQLPSVSDIKQVLNMLHKELKSVFFSFTCSNQHPLKPILARSGMFFFKSKIHFCVYGLNDATKIDFESIPWIISPALFHRY